GADFVPIAGRFDDDSFIADVNDLGAKDANQAQHLLALGAGPSGDIDQGHLAFDVPDPVHIDRAQNADLFVEMAADLLNGFVVAAGNEGHARDIRVEGFSNREAFDIEATCAEEADDTGQFAETVFN